MRVCVAERIRHRRIALDDGTLSRVHPRHRLLRRCATRIESRGGLRLVLELRGILLRVLGSRSVLLLRLVLGLDRGQHIPGRGLILTLRRGLLLKLRRRLILRRVGVRVRVTLGDLRP